MHKNSIAQERISALEQLTLDRLDPVKSDRWHRRLALAKRYLRSGEFGACNYELDVLEHIYSVRR